MRPPEPSRELIWQQVHWPVPLDGQLASGLLRRWASDLTRQPIIWEVRVSEGTVTHMVGTPAHQVKAVTRAIEGLVPGTATSAEGDARPQVARSARLQVKGQQLHLAADNAPHAARTLLAALTEAHFREEHAVLQVVLSRGRSPQTLQAQPADPTQSWFEVLASGGRPASSELAGRMRDKANQPGFEAVVRLAATAKSEARRVTIMQGILAALRTLQAPGVRIDFVKDSGDSLDRALVPFWAPLRLSADEVLSLIAWPLEADDLPGLPAAHPKALRLSGTDIEKVRVFAKTTAPGKVQPLGLSIEDNLFHSVILGPTGSGKSTAMLNLIVADLKAGRGLVVIDPKGDLVQDILERIPQSRRGDVAVLDPTDPVPVGLNPLRVPGTSAELIADSVVTIFRDLFPSSFGPRTSEMVHASILTLANHPSATLTWLPRLLADARFRSTLIGGLSDPDGLESLWADYGEMSERQQAQFAGPVLSRLRQFLLRPSLKRVLDQSEPKFQLEEVFTKHKVLLVPLNTGILGNDAARLLGSLLVSQLWQLTLGRAAQSKSQRPPVSIYVDELQEFIHLGGNDLSDALARSRSLGVAWNLAHQFRDQLPTDTKNALDANALNKIIFGLGVKDAREVAAMAPDLIAEDFMTLPQYGIYASLMRNRRHLGWVSGQTAPPPAATSSPIEIIATSQARYGREPEPTNESSAPASQNAKRKPSDEPIGRRRRRTS
ncbi:type IV secretory system conjugative DNA transfer family protein [Leifsonia bigeumensis]|uniref:Type IV secretory system conjugative DNA transfer family protein n=2 Tax=Leifsonella bigeumensis TaxID=433643 RepID=A0ABP7FFU2_9MICO